MKLPLVDRGFGHFPREPVCPVCGQRKVWEPHTFFALEGGALVADRSAGTERSSAELSGFLTLVWHGAHDGGEGEHCDAFGAVSIADGAPNGQFSLAVCSPDCLRILLGSWVDELERRIEARNGGSERAPLDPEIERHWADEAERRIREYRAGRMSAVPANEVQREARRLEEAGRPMITISWSAEQREFVAETPALAGRAARGRSYDEALAHLLDAMADRGDTSGPSGSA